MDASAAAAAAAATYHPTRPRAPTHAAMPIGDKIELERLLRATQGISQSLEDLLVQGSGGGAPRPTGEHAMLNLELLEAPVLVRYGIDSCLTSTGA